MKFLSAGGGINLTNNSGFTPAHHAVEAGATETLTALIAAGANLTIPMRRARYRSTPLVAAEIRPLIMLLETAVKKPAEASSTTATMASGVSSAGVFIVLDREPERRLEREALRALPAPSWLKHPS